MKELEIWRDIIGYEDYYEVSNLGRIRSLDRTVLTKNGREYFYKGRFFEGNDVNGYKMVTLSKNGKQRVYNISQLVAVCFLNHIPNGHSLVIDHRDGNRSNNNVENLQIVTHRENTSTCYRANEDSFSSEFIGITYHKQTDRWLAQIRLNSKLIYLGLFNNEIDAAKAYQKALGEIENGTFKLENYRASFTSKHKGVTFHKANQKWVANPSINGKQVYLGIHTTEEEAFQMILLFESAQPIEK